MQALELLRAFARYKTHAGYFWAAVMADGELMCERCVRENYRQCYRETRDESQSGWACIGLTNCGETEDPASCVHCNRTLWEV